MISYELPLVLSLVGLVFRRLIGNNITQLRSTSKKGIATMSQSVMAEH